jgi:hypothetical protein
MGSASGQVPASLSSQFHSLEWDVARGRGVIKLTDGRMASVPVAIPVTSDGAGIARMVYSFGDGALVITTPDGESAAMQIESSTDTTQDAGHPVVYLDQGHWSALAGRIDDPGSVSHPDDAVAADKIIGWARDQRIVLPVSSGHVIETTPLYGVKRRRLALTMLQMSHGWHMRNPVHVRRDEIASVLNNVGASATGHDRPEVFTLDVDSQYSTLAAAQPQPAGLPEYLNWLCTRLAAVAAEFDLLTDPQRIAPTKTTGWCEELAALGRDAEFRALPVARRRAAARTRALIDGVADPPVLALLQRSGLSPADAAPVLLQGLEVKADKMPFLRLYADALAERLVNRARWEPNDLIDMLYLACAAAYADVVVAEHKATQYLTAAWRGRQEPCPVVPTLRELASRLTDLGLE